MQRPYGQLATGLLGFLSCLQAPEGVFVDGSGSVRGVECGARVMLA